MNHKNLPKVSKTLLKHVLFSAVLEFGPVAIFLLSFSHMTIYEATIILMVATIISTIATFQIQKRIPYLALYMAAITIIFGFMTIHFHKAKFIQMRDTLYDVTCAVTLLIGMLLNIPFLRLAFGSVIPMSLRAWNKLTHLWIGYFLIIALSNEIVRRLFPLHVWLDFKGWIVLTTSLFGIISLYLSYEEKE